MEKSKASFLFIALVAMSTFTLVSCRKDKSDDGTVEANEVTFMNAEKSFSSDVDHVTKSSIIDPNCEPSGFLSPCVSVTDSGEDIYPRTITLDYGNGCVGPGGNIRSGQIHIHLTDDLSEVGAIRTVTFEDFSFNGRQLNGERITTRITDTSSGEPQFNRIIDMTVTYNSLSIDRYFEENIVWTSGFETEACGDNVFTITGSGYIIRPNGTQVNRTISIPLVHDFVCGYTVSGAITVDAPGGVRIIDFGEGECDDQAVVFFNGNSNTITLH